MFTQITKIMALNASQKYARLRAKLLTRGYTVRQWALEQGFPPTTAYSALRGDRKGPISISIIQRLEECFNA